ncbi:MAG: hypothetical protein DA328_10020 [Nitrososphaeraceae archaeon]|nr:hypothetical protein [Nitrososphaeraceae archaeon]
MFFLNIYSVNKINYQIKSKSDWAPSLWNHLHLMGYNYPDSPTENDKNKIKTKILSLIEDIPCGDCKEHATEYYKKNPIDVNSKIGVFNWTTKFHNDVNKRLGKPVYDVVLNNDIKSNTITSNNNIMDPIGAKFNYRYAFDSVPQSTESIPFYQIQQPEQLPDPVETRKQYLNNALSPMSESYKFVSEFIGVSPEELNLMYTPNVINNIIQLLIDMNLTPFASFSVNVLGSLGLVFGSILGRNNKNLLHGK